jgi:hypothetical protein
MKVTVRTRIWAGALSADDGTEGVSANESVIDPSLVAGHVIDLALLVALNPWYRLLLLMVR